MKYSNLVKSALPAAVLGFLALGFASTSAYATTTNTGTFVVSTVVSTSCSIAPTALTFPTYIGAVTSASTTIAITCNAAPTNGYTVGLNGGTSGGSDTARMMAGQGAAAGNTLNYKLCSDSSTCATNWGNTSGTGAVVVPSGSGIGSQTLTVYGQIPAAQTSPQGTYADTVTASITY
jgi:spore coat protein U-like protein